MVTEGWKRLPFYPMSLKLIQEQSPLEQSLGSVKLRKTNSQSGRSSMQTRHSTGNQRSTRDSGTGRGSVTFSRLVDQEQGQTEMEEGEDQTDFDERAPLLSTMGQDSCDTQAVQAVNGRDKSGDTQNTHQHTDTQHCTTNIQKDSVVLSGPGGGHTVVRPVSIRNGQRCLTLETGGQAMRQRGDRGGERGVMFQVVMAGGVKEEISAVIGGDDEDDTGISLCGWVLTSISLLLVIITLPFSLCVCFKVVQEYERAVIFRLGRLLSGGSKGPGIFFVMPCIESYKKVDLRTITLGVPPQEVLTKDSVTVSVDAVVYYRVSNATVSVANVENAHHSTRLLAQTTLRNILGTKNLHEILSDRDSISGSMQAALDEATGPWGIKVERVEIKDARLPVQLQRAMAAEAEAAREARAKVIAAEGEQKASKSLAAASQVMDQSSAALQLRYLQTLNSISAEKNSTIIFPLPMDLVKNMVE